MSNQVIAIDALTTIKGATGKVIKNKDGTSAGILTLDTGIGKQELTLDQFDSIYRGFVTCWPTVSPLKQQIVVANREAIKAAKDKEREDAKAAKVAEREAAKKKREEEQAAAKKAKEDAKAAKKKAAEDAAAAKKKADMEKAQKAANAKAKKDKAAGTK